MTEDQKAISLVLELLNASRNVPRTLSWLDHEMRLAGRRAETPAILDLMTDKKLVVATKDALGIRRYSLTKTGKEALDLL